jgi:hypothetical protein
VGFEVLHGGDYEEYLNFWNVTPAYTASPHLVDVEEAMHEILQWRS